MFLRLFIGVFTLLSPVVYSGTLTYSNVTGARFTFSQIYETSPQNTFLGGNAYGFPSSTPAFAAFQDSNGQDYIKLSPSAALTGNTQGGPWPPGPLSGSTKLSLMIDSPNSLPIPGAKIRMEGTARVREPQTNSTASFYLDTAVYLDVFGLTGTPLVPSTLSKTILLNPLTYQDPGLVNWVVEWQSTNLESLFADPVFSSPTIKISRLSLSINPFFELTAENQGYAEFYVNQVQVAVIPEPGTGPLLFLGLATLLRKRRNSPWNAPQA